MDREKPCSVYSFGSSGSPLSQYMAYAKEARDTFNPSALVIVVVGNDFDEALLQYKREPGFHYLKRNDDDSYAVVLLPWHPSLLGRIAAWPALGRYLLANLSLWSIKERIFSPQQVYVGNVAEHASQERLEQSKRAVDFFLENLPSYSGLPAHHILFLVDVCARIYTIPTCLQPHRAAILM